MQLKWAHVSWDFFTAQKYKDITLAKLTSKWGANRRHEIQNKDKRRIRVWFECISQSTIMKGKNYDIYSNHISINGKRGTGNKLLKVIEEK